MDEQHVHGDAGWNLQPGATWLLSKEHHSNTFFTACADFFTFQ
jgi:hypothetical protein